MTDIGKLRHRCFFDINIGDKEVGRIVFELYNDICPKTCDNFRSLCTGEKGLGKTTAKPLHYKNVIFHRVVKGFIIQSGDFSMGNGRGGESIFGGTFNDENFVLKHEKPFLLSMANRGKNTNGSQFFITLNPAPHLDGVHVVFGHVLSGEDIINEVQNQETGEDGRPLLDVIISNCGELIPQIKPKEKKKKHKKVKKKSDGELSSDEDIGENNKNKKKRDKKHKKHKKSKKNENESTEEKEKESEELDINCSVKPEEIPDIPENKYLMRDTESNANKWEDNRRQYRYDQQLSRRKVKGRGPTRYRTPSPSHHYRSGSETPPHWRSAQSKLVTLKDVLTAKQRDRRDDRHSNSKRNERSREWSRQSNSFRPVFGRNNRDFDIRDRFRREGSETEVKNNGNGQTSSRKRTFTEDPPSNHPKRESLASNGSHQREEQNENNITSYASDSDYNSKSEVRHSVKSEVKLNVRNRMREVSRERDRSPETKHQSPLDLKSIPLPDSDSEKKKSYEKRDRNRSEVTHNSHSKRERTHRRSNSTEKSSQRVSSRRRRYSSDSN